MVYKHAYSNILLLLHSAFMLCIVKKQLKGEVRGCALNSHGNYIVDRRKSWKNHGILFLNFCGNPALSISDILTNILSEPSSSILCVFKKQRLWMSRVVVQW